MRQPLRKPDWPEWEASQRPLGMFVLSLASYLLFYGINIFLARHLTVEEFDDYNIGISLTLLLSTVCTLGLEKYALLCLPMYRERSSWELSKGYLRFSRRVIFRVSVLAVLLIWGLMEGLLPNFKTESHLPVLIIAGFLPALCLFLFWIEVLTAYGKPLHAAFIYRILLPGLVAFLNALVWLSPVRSTALTAGLSLGLSWLVVLAVSWWLLKLVLPRELRKVKLESLGREWLSGAIPLLSSSAMLTTIAHSGVIILGIVHSSEVSVSAYALAFQTGTFVVLLGTSTNRLYLPMISELLERNDLEGMRQVSRQRMWVVAPISLLFVLCMVILGHPLLGLFGEPYQVGYPALCLIALGSAVGTVFSISPYFLQSVHQTQLVVRWTAAATIVSIFSCIPLSIRMNATGAAWAYSVPLIVLYLAFGYRVSEELRRQTVS